MAGTEVLSIILGGGRGERLFPLTKERAKPAVPFGGRYRLVDIPISNCINSDFRQIYVLTQFNSASLHNHVANTYVFDTFSKGFVEILAAEQTFEHSDWYLGTADAVRKNFLHFRDLAPDYYLILSGDQLYRMDLERFVQTHIEKGAEVSVAAKYVNRTVASSLGIMRIEADTRIVEFLEKPGPEADIDDLAAPSAVGGEQGTEPGEPQFLVSMGIYIFSAAALQEALDNNATDFGHDIIPASISSHRVFAYPFDDFWADIGTISSFYETNLNLTRIEPDFNFYDERRPIYTHRRDLAATKVNSCYVYQSLIADGSILTYSNLMNSIVGIRTKVEPDAHLDGVVCMGADYYETPAQLERNRTEAIPDVGIGRGTRIRRAIIDKNARIGNECSIGMSRETVADSDAENYSVRDGIIVIPKNAIIPTATVI